MNVENKFVFVGFTAKGIMPQLATPVGLLEPTRYKAALAESILIEDSPYLPDYALAVEMAALVIGVVMMWLLINFWHVWCNLGFSIYGRNFVWWLHSGTTRSIDRCNVDLW